MKKARKKIVFFGSPEIAASCLESLLSSHEFEIITVVTQPDKLGGRGNKPLMPPVKKIALQHGLAVLQPSKLSKELDGFITALSEHADIDGALVVAYGQILPEKLLHFFNNKCVNVHTSLLPRWRGSAPIQRAIMAGDKKTGICLMQMEKGLDTGPVWSQEEVNIADNETFSTLHSKLTSISCNLINRDLCKILNGEIVGIPQKVDGITYAHKITNDECKIEWNKPAHEVSCHIRGIWPRPGAFTLYNSKRLKIGLSLPSVENEKNDLSPGQIISFNKSKITVKCMDSSIDIFEIQLEGQRSVPVKDFLNGHKIEIGLIWG